MRVRYQIIVECEADGMMGPLKVLERIRHRVDRIGDNENPQSLTIGHIRLAACYPLAPPEQKPVVERVPGRDRIGPHIYEGTFGAGDVCSACGLSAKDPLHMEKIIDQRIT